MNKYLGIAALVIVILFGLTLYFFGNARYDAGVSSCKEAKATEAAEANDDARKDKENNAIREKAIPDDGLDAELRRLNIMRPDTDY